MQEWVWKRHQAATGLLLRRGGTCRCSQHNRTINESFLPPRDPVVTSWQLLVSPSRMFPCCINTPAKSWTRKGTSSRFGHHGCWEWERHMQEFYPWLTACRLHWGPDWSPLAASAAAPASSLQSSLQSNLLVPQQWPGTSVLLCWCSLARTAVVWQLLLIFAPTPSSSPPRSFVAGSRPVKIRPLVWQHAPETNNWSSGQQAPAHTLYPR